MQETVIVGEAVAGHAHELRNKIESLVKTVNTDTFTLAGYLHEAKWKQYYYGWGFNSFRDYAHSLGIKPSKAYYLARIIEVMTAVGIPREDYEKIGMAKLREISRLTPGTMTKLSNGNVVTTNSLIKHMIVNEEFELEEVVEIVQEAQGKVGEDAFVWLNINILKSARDMHVKPAIAVAKKQIGSVGTDDDGMAKDASDGAALERICQDFLSDPNNKHEGEPDHSGGLHASTQVGPEPSQSQNPDSTEETGEESGWAGQGD
jgi:hypothetical protein